MRSDFVDGNGVTQTPSVIVPDAVSNQNPMTLGDIKSREAIYEFDLDDGIEFEIDTTLDLEKTVWNLVDNDESVQVDVVLDTSTPQHKFLVTATGGNLTDVRLLARQLSCSVTTL